jgi:hypothetical protein
MRTKLLALVIIGISACNEPVKVYEAPKKQFEVVARNGTGFNHIYSKISCDSFQFKNSKHIIIYVDGIRMEIFADNKINVRDSR